MPYTVDDICMQVQKYQTSSISQDRMRRTLLQVCIQWQSYSILTSNIMLPFSRQTSRSSAIPEGIYAGEEGYKWLHHQKWNLTRVRYLARIKSEFLHAQHSAHGSFIYLPLKVDSFASLLFLCCVIWHKIALLFHKGKVLLCESVWRTGYFPVSHPLPSFPAPWQGPCLLAPQGALGGPEGSSPVQSIHFSFWVHCGAYPSVIVFFICFLPSIVHCSAWCPCVCCNYLQNENSPALWHQASAC